MVPYALNCPCKMLRKKNIFCTLFFVMYFPNRIFICIWHPVTVVIFYSDSLLMFPFLAISLHIAVSLSFLTPYVIFLPCSLVSSSLIPVSISPIFHVPQLLFLRCLFKAIVVSSSSNHFWIHSPMEPSTHHPTTRLYIHTRLLHPHLYRLPHLHRHQHARPTRPSVKR